MSKIKVSRKPENDPENGPHWNAWQYLQYLQEGAQGLCIRRKPIYFAPMQRTPAECWERNGSLKKSLECILGTCWTCWTLLSVWVAACQLTCISNKLSFLADQIFCLKYSPVYCSIPENPISQFQVIFGLCSVRPAVAQWSGFRPHSNVKKINFLWWQKVRSVKAKPKIFSGCDL